MKELVQGDIRPKIDYEWTVLQESLDKKYIRGMYASLDRLCKLYRQRDKK